MKITDEMVTELNTMLADEGCIFRIAISNESNPSISVVPNNEKYIRNVIINLNDEFYSFIETFFKCKGIKLSYNNTRDIMRSMSGWDED